MKKIPGFKIYFESCKKVLPLYQYLWSGISRQWNNGPLNFFLKFIGKSLSLLKFCQMRQILKSQFCWYFENALLWFILMEMKVSQVGHFQITGRWRCYQIFSDILFIVLFTRLLSKILYEETILFQLKCQKSISRCSVLQKIKMSNFLMLKMAALWR